MLPNKGQPGFILSGAPYNGGVPQTLEPDSELLLRTQWYIRLRWFLLLAIVLPTLGSLYFGSSLSSQRLSGLVISTVVFAANGVFYILSKLHRGQTYHRVLAMCLLAFDVLFITYFIYDKGGIESRSQLLYALPILMAAALFGRLAVYITAAASAAAYDLVILANYWGIVHSPEAITHQAMDGSYVLNTIIFFTAVLLMVGVLADFITRLLVEKEQEARATAAALKRAQEIAKVGSWEWDAATRAITSSEELYKIFGFSKEAPPQSYEDFLRRIHPDDRKWSTAIIGRSLKTHKPFRFDFRVIRPDKSVHVLHNEGAVLMAKRHEVSHLYGTVRDITAERALDAAKGDFVSLASHQLRTPASGVRMLLAMLRDGYVGGLTPEQRATVQQAYDANERLLHIADDLLNVAKLESGRLVLNKREMELCSWLRQTAAPHGLLAKEHHQKLQLDLPKPPATMLGDPERLAMVVDNLLSNARKYTPPRGIIHVTLVSVRNFYKITVSDTGNGMTKAEVAQLFGKFTRLDNPASKGVDGTGLGLYLAKSIVDLHQGSIKVQSKVGTGTTFTIRLPKAQV